MALYHRRKSSRRIPARLELHSIKNKHEVRISLHLGKPQYDGADAAILNA